MSIPAFARTSVDKTDRRLLEATATGLGGFGPAADAVPLQASMGGAARQIGLHAASHDLDDVVERQLDAGAQLTDQFFFQGRERAADLLGPGGAVVGGVTAAPAFHRPAADAEFGDKLGDGGGARLDVGSFLGRRDGVGVKLQLHDPRRSVRCWMPQSTPAPSRHLAGPNTKAGIASASAASFFWRFRYGFT